MSWSIEVTGSKEGASAKVTAELDRLAANYAGKPEADDIVAVKGRLLGLIDAMELSTDGYTSWNGVIVKANGSHGTATKGLTSANASFSVVRTVLAL